MRVNREDTPPSSEKGDEIVGMEEDSVIFLDDMEEQYEYPYMYDGGQMDSLSEGEEPPDLSTVVFNEHCGSVFCCDLNPDGTLAVTGGQDDKAYVWSAQDGHVVMECTGHKDSIIFAGFSFDGEYLATVDMSGVIKVWKVVNDNTGNPWPLSFEYEIDDLSFGLWHFGERVLICGVVTGDIYIFKIPSGQTKILQGQNKRAECAKLFKDGVRLAVGYYDGAVKVWDLKTSKVIQQLSDGHEMDVTAIDIHPDNNLMASICMGYKIILSTSSNGKVVSKQQAEENVECVAFAQDPEVPYFALGTLNGSVSIWDTAKQMIRYQCTTMASGYEPGVIKLLWIKDNLLTGCTNGSIRGYDGKSGEMNVLLTGNKSEILDFCYNEKENIILTASEDGTGRIFKYEKFAVN